MIQKIKAISYLKKLLNTSHTGVKANKKTTMNLFMLSNLEIFGSIIKVKTPKRSVVSLRVINNFSWSNKESTEDFIVNGFIMLVI